MGIFNENDLFRFYLEYIKKNKYFSSKKLCNNFCKELSIITSYKNSNTIKITGIFARINKKLMALKYLEKYRATTYQTAEKVSELTLNQLIDIVHRNRRVNGITQNETIGELIFKILIEKPNTVLQKIYDIFPDCEIHYLKKLYIQFFEIQIYQILKENNNTELEHIYAKFPKQSRTRIKSLYTSCIKNEVFSVLLANPHLSRVDIYNRFPNLSHSLLGQFISRFYKAMSLTIP